MLLELDDFFLQTAQDCLAFRSGLPTWSVSLESIRSLDKSNDLSDFYFGNNDIAELYKRPVLEIFEIISKTDEKLGDFCDSIRNDIYSTAYSNHDPLVSLFKNFDTWRTWELLWSISASKHIIESDRDTGILPFGGNWRLPEGEFKVEFGDNWKVKYFILHELDIVIFVGPFFSSRFPHDSHHDDIVFYNTVKGLQYLVSKFGNDINKFELPKKLLQRISSLRPIQSLDEICRQADTMRVSFDCLLNFGVEDNARKALTEYDLPLIPIDHITGLVGFIDYIVDTDLLQEDFTIVFELPTIVDDNDVSISGFRCSYSQGKFDYLHSSNPWPIRERFTNRLAVYDADGSHISTSDLKIYDGLLSNSIIKVRRARHSFRNEQARIARGALNELSGDWITYANELVDDTEKTNGTNPWSIFKPAAQIISTLIFRMLRADIVHVYAYEDGPQDLIHIESVHNRRTDRGTGKSPHGDRLLLRDKPKKERIRESIAYRCLHHALDSYEFDRDHSSELWVKKFKKDLNERGKGLFVTDVYKKDPGSEIAIELSAHGRVWGVIVVTGYRPHHFEASSLATLESLGRLFSAQLFQAWFVANLKRLAEEILNISSQENPSFSGLSKIVGQITLSSAVALWVDLYDQGFYQALDHYHRPDIAKFKDSENAYRFVMKSDINSHMAKIIREFGSSNTILKEWKLSEGDDAPVDALDYLLKNKLRYAYVLFLKSSSGSTPAFLTIHTKGRISPAWKKTLEFLSSYLGSSVQVLFEKTREERMRIEAHSHTIRQLPSQLSENGEQLFDLIQEKYRNVDPIILRLAENLRNSTKSLEYNLASIFDTKLKNLIPPEFMNPNKNGAHRDNDLVPVNSLVFGILDKYPKHERSIGHLHMTNVGVYSKIEPLSTIITNLYENALKYRLANSQVRIEFLEGRNTIKIVFSNLGKKLKDWEKNLIFGPGFQGSNSVDVEEGRGYGLSLCRMIASEWGVKIEYESKNLSRLETNLVFDEQGDYHTVIEDTMNQKDGEDNTEWHVFSVVFDKYLVDTLRVER